MSTCLCVCHKCHNSSHINTTHSGRLNRLLEPIRRNASTGSSPPPSNPLSSPLPCHRIRESRSHTQKANDPMELAVPCNSCNWIHRKPDFYRKTTPLKSRTFPFNASKCRCKTTSELQSTVGVTGSAGGSYSHANTIPTHKVTVHDRQRGVVHEFVVPEVCTDRVTVCFQRKCARKSGVSSF